MFRRKREADDISLPPFPRWPGISSSRDSALPRSDGSTGGRPPEEYAQDLWRLGWFDGRLGQPSTDLEDLLRAYAEEDHRRTIVALENEQAAGRRDEGIATERLQSAATRGHRVGIEKEKLLDERDRNSHEFSPFIGAFYFIVAFVLLAADIPLSFKLVNDAFGISTKLPEAGLVIGDIFDHTKTLDVLAGLWDAILLGVGIVMLGIVFKLATDYLLGTHDWNGWQLTVFRSVRVAYFVGVFAITVGALLCLGLLRSEERNAAKTASIADDKAMFTSNSSHGAPDTANRPTSSGTPGIMSDSTAANSWTPLAFTLLALAFPMVGGTAMALGAKRSRKWWRLVKLHFWDWLYSRRSAKAECELTTARATLSFLPDRIAALRGTKSTPELRIWQEMYRHGYHRGYCVPQTLADHPSMNAWCKAMVKKWIAGGAQHQNTIRALRADSARSARNA
jgi:hypothetical protein